MRPQCPVTEDELNALVDGELCGREQGRVSAHVLCCDDCRSLVGQTLATKRLMGVRSQALDPPTGSWETLLTAMDEVDGMARATTYGPPARRLDSVPLLAAAGLVVMVVAAGWLYLGGRHAVQAVQFVRTHAAACSDLAPGVAMARFGDVTAPRADGMVWVPVARTLFPVDGQVFEQTLYRVDRTAVSELLLSASAFSSDGLTPVRASGADYLVGVEHSGSVVAWRSGAMVRVLVSRTAPQDLLAMAVARRAQIPLARSF